MASNTPPIPGKVAAIPVGAMPVDPAAASKPAVIPMSAVPAATTAIDDMSLAPPINFWQQKWAQRVLPLASSLLLHAGIILLGLLTIQAGRTILRVMKQQ